MFQKKGGISRRGGEKRKGGLIHLSALWYLFSFFRNETLNMYSKALIEQWIKAFGIEHVITCRSVMKKLEKLVDNFYNHVYKGNYKPNTNILYFLLHPSV